MFPKLLKAQELGTNEIQGWRNEIKCSLASLLYAKLRSSLVIGLIIEYNAAQP